jgi:hypothetical protein
MGSGGSWQRQVSVVTWQCQALFILCGFFIAWRWAAWRRKP